MPHSDRDPEQPRGENAPAAEDASAPGGVSRRESLKLASALLALGPGLGLALPETLGASEAGGKARLAWYTTEDGKEFKELAVQAVPEEVARIAASRGGPRFEVDWTLDRDGEKRPVYSQGMPAVMLKVEWD